MLEAEELVGHEFNDDEDHAIAVREMVGLGAREAIMTTPDGCYALMAPEEPGAARALYRVRMPAGSIEPRATVGSGDAFLAGFVASRYAGRSPVECLRLRRRLRRRVHAAPRRRPGRPRAGRPPAVGDRGRAPRAAGGSWVIFRAMDSPGGG